MTTTEAPNRRAPLNERIRWAREHARTGRISQERFAAMIGTSRRHLMRIENGSTQRPRAALLARIAEASGHDLDFFVDEDDEEDDQVTIDLMQALRAYVRHQTQSNDQHAHLPDEHVLVATERTVPDEYRDSE